MVSTIAARGPWYDEYYTFYVAQPGIPWIDALTAHWLADNHPPAYYALVRATAWLGTTVEARRLVNLGIAAGAFVAGTALVLRHRQGTLLATVFAIGVAGAPAVLPAATDLRSNFLALAASAVALLALVLLAAPGRPLLTWRRSGLLAAALMLAFNVHYVASLLVGVTAAGFGIRLLLARDWGKAARLVGAGAIAALPLAATLVAQAGRIEANTRDFWIPAGFDPARWTIERYVLDMLLANPVLLIAGLAGHAWLLRDAVQARRADPRLTLAVQLALSTAVALVLLVAVHLVRPVVVGRYLPALVAPIAMALAAGAVVPVERLRRAVSLAILAGITIGAVLAVHSGRLAALARPSWSGTASAIAAIRRACPGTLVHIDVPWNAPVAAMPPSDNRAVMPFAYARTAARWGIPVQPGASRRMAQACPTIFWVEHVAGTDPDPGTIIVALRSRGFAVPGGTYRRIGDGWIVVVPAARSSPAVAAARPASA